MKNKRLFILYLLVCCGIGIALGLAYPDIQAWFDGEAVTFRYKP